MPLVAKTDKMALEYAIRTCGPIESDNIKMIRVKDTLHMGEMYVTKAVLEDIEHYSNIEVVGDFVDIINEENELIKF